MILSDIRIRKTTLILPALCAHALFLQPFPSKCVGNAVRPSPTMGCNQSRALPPVITDRAETRGRVADSESCPGPWIISHSFL